MNVPEEHLKKFATLLDRAKEINESELARDDFMAFTKVVWEDFINGRHHKIMAEKFNRLARGELKRLIVNMPPCLLYTYEAGDEEDSVDLGGRRHQKKKKHHKST